MALFLEQQQPKKGRMPIIQSKLPNKTCVEGLVHTYLKTLEHSLTL